MTLYRSRVFKKNRLVKNCKVQSKIDWKRIKHSSKGSAVAKYSKIYFNIPSWVFFVWDWVKSSHKFIVISIRRLLCDFLVLIQAVIQIIDTKIPEKTFKSPCPNNPLQKNLILDKKNSIFLFQHITNYRSKFAGKL